MRYSQNDEMIMLAAERYAMGRRGRIVSTVASYITERVPELSDLCLGELAQHYKDKLKEAGRLHNYGVFGDALHKKDWDALYLAVLDEIERRATDGKTDSKAGQRDQGRLLDGREEGSDRPEARRV